jgi:DNA-binding LacI/PurR family transcriptional regulator
MANGGYARPPTLADVAQLAGVAVSTVSRALSRPERVNEHTRIRVQSAARSLKYVPNASARALSSGRKGTIAVLVPDITNPFYFGIIRGTQHALKAAGYIQVLVDTEESGESELALLTKLQQSCDGAILAAPRLSDARIAELGKLIPIVTINRPQAGIGSVVIDTTQGVVQGVEHLVSLGHKRIVYVPGPATSWSSDRRWKAILKLTERLPFEAIRVPAFAPTVASGTAAADAVVNTGASACITFNDLLAIGMLQRFAERGIRVPRDLSILGCDDIFGSDFCSPPLTTLTAPIEQAGRVAVSILLEDPENRRPQNVLLPTHLTVRETTGPAGA